MTDIDSSDEETVETEEVVYSEMTIPELKEELDARGIEYLASARKDDLIALLEEDDTAAAEAGDRPADGSTEARTGTESDPALSDPREAEREAWIEANPDATVIPPTLLPPAYQDGTVITPGWPGEAPVVVEEEVVEDDAEVDE